MDDDQRECEMGAAALRSLLVLAVTSVISMSLITSCESYHPTLTAPETETTPSGGWLVGEVPGLSIPSLEIVEGFIDLEISERLRTVAVTFPGVDEVGVCHVQVTRRDRPVPFGLERIEVSLPRAVFEEAAGQSALVEYRFRGRNGLLLEAARCRVPRSRSAVEIVLGHFSRQGSNGSVAPGEPRWDLHTSRNGEGWKVIVGPGSPLRSPVSTGLVVAMTEGGEGPDPCIPGPDDPPLDPEEPSDEPCELEEILVGGGDESCDNPFHDYDPELGECGCENGSEAEDCWLEGDGPGDGSEPPDDGGGSGGGGSGGDGSGSGSGGSTDGALPPPPGEVDTIAVGREIPDCEAGPPFAHWSGNAWCAGQEPDSVQLSRPLAALDSIAERGDEDCQPLANQGRALLEPDSLGRRGIRIFETPPDSVGAWSGAATGNGYEWMVLHKGYLDLHDKTVSTEPVIDTGSDQEEKYYWAAINLQWAVAHELDHNVNGAKHVNLPSGSVEAVYETPLSPRCSGLPGFQPYEPGN